MSQMFVQRGRSIVIDGVVHPPGAQVTLAADETARLRALGFLQTEPPILTEAAPANVSGIGLQGFQGPVFRR